MDFKTSLCGIDRAIVFMMMLVFMFGIGLLMVMSVNTRVYSLNGVDVKTPGAIKSNICGSHPNVE